MVTDHGAVPDDGNDDTAAIQATLDLKRSAPDFGRAGGCVGFPKGIYDVKGTLSAESSTGLTIMGEGGITPGFKHPSASTIKYHGADSFFLDVRSASGFRLTGMGIQYDNAGFTGDLIDFHRASPKAPDPSLATIENNFLGGTRSALNAHAIIYARDIITSSFRRNNIAFGVHGIEGKRPPEFQQANGVTISENQFLMLSGGAIVNPGQGYNITGNIFEGTNLVDGKALTRAVTDDFPAKAGAVIAGVTFSGNWLGDLNVQAYYDTVWLSSEHGGAFWAGWTISDNFGPAETLVRASLPTPQASPSPATTSRPSPACRRSTSGPVSAEWSSRATPSATAVRNPRHGRQPGLAGQQPGQHRTRPPIDEQQSAALGRTEQEVPPCGVGGDVVAGLRAVAGEKEVPIVERGQHLLDRSSRASGQNLAHDVRAVTGGRTKHPTDHVVFGHLRIDLHEVDTGDARALEVIVEGGHVDLGRHQLSLGDDRLHERAGEAGAAGNGVRDVEEIS